MSVDKPLPVYERIGAQYAKCRQSDSRWLQVISGALQGCRSLVNVGAGSGSYEPDSMDVVAVEPSDLMIRQRAITAAPAIRAVAENLPFANQSFDASMAILTTHHWSDVAVGIEEMRRVSRLQILVTWDPEIFAHNFWLVRDYLPEIYERERNLSTLRSVLDNVDEAEVLELTVPSDCIDGFLGAFWQRPEAYLSAGVRAAMSGLALLDHDKVVLAIERLREDLASGVWLKRNRTLLKKMELDLGYRMVVARSDL